MPLTQLFSTVFFLEESFFHKTTFSFIHFGKSKCNMYILKPIIPNVLAIIFTFYLYILCGIFLVWFLGRDMRCVKLTESKLQLPVLKDTRRFIWKGRGVSSASLFPWASSTSGKCSAASPRPAAPIPPYRRPQCLRFSQAQDGFGWIQTEDVIWESKWTHARLGVQQLVNQCSAVSVQAAAVWWVDGAAMQDYHWGVQVRWDDNMNFFFIF